MDLLNHTIKILNRRCIGTEYISATPITHWFIYLGYEFYVWWDSKDMYDNDLNLEFRISVAELECCKWNIQQYIYRANETYKIVDIELKKDFIHYSIYLMIEPSLFTIEMLIVELKRIIEVVGNIECDLDSMFE